MSPPSTRPSKSNESVGRLLCRAVAEIVGDTQWTPRVDLPGQAQRSVLGARCLARPRAQGGAGGARGVSCVAKEVAGRARGTIGRAEGTYRGGAFGRGDRERSGQGVVGGQDGGDGAEGEDR